MSELQITSFQAGGSLILVVIMKDIKVCHWRNKLQQQ